MAKKKLTEEQENEIKTLLENNKMLEKTKKEAESRGKTQSVKQIERAQQEVIDHINSIDPTVLGSSTKKTSLSSAKKEVYSKILICQFLTYWKKTTKLWKKKKKLKLQRLQVMMNMI